MKPFKIVVFIIGAVLFLGTSQSCKRGVSISETDFKDMYSSNSGVPQPRFRVYHTTNSSTEINYMFENKGLTYSMESKSKQYMAQVRIAWQLYTDYSSKEVIDSSSFIKIDTIATTGISQLQGTFNIDVDFGSNYILKVTTTDLNNSQKTISFLNINKKDERNRQFFKVILKENNSVLFRNYFYKHEKLAIIYKHKSISQFIGRNYKTIFPVSSPPFSMVNPKPFDFDNFYSVILEVVNDTAAFEADEAGIYHFGIDDKSSRSGLTLFQYPNDFPEVNTTKEMFDPLRFVTSKREYGKMKKYQNLKKAVDDFWLSTSSDPEKAKKFMINR